MPKLFLICFVILFLLGCEKEDYSFYFERDGNIYKYDIISQKESGIAMEPGKNKWGLRLSEKYGLFVEDSIKNINGEEVILGDIKLIDWNSKKGIATIGIENANDYCGDIYKDNVVYISDKSGKKEIYSYNIITKKEKKISESKGDSIYPVISKEKNTLFYQSYNAVKEGWEILSYNFETEKREKIEDKGRKFEYPSVSHSGKYIAFEESDINRIYITIYDTETKDFIKISEQGDERYPVFSKDDKNILYVSAGDVWLYAMDEKKSSKLVSFPSGVFATNPRWFGSDRIIVERVDGNTREICMINVKEKKVEKITKGSVPYITDLSKN